MYCCNGLCKDRHCTTTNADCVRDADCLGAQVCCPSGFCQKSLEDCPATSKENSSESSGLRDSTTIAAGCLGFALVLNLAFCYLSCSRHEQVQEGERVVFVLYNSPTPYMQLEEPRTATAVHLPPPSARL